MNKASGQEGQPAGHSYAHDTAKPVFVDLRSRLIDERLNRFAPSDASVLIVGETGTGKELIARQIHERSGRSGPFVAVNCGALSESLGEAALFGNEAGAYTGATMARAGWFEAAHKGTLFLDEIGDLPPTLQVALLRVLQERQVVRLGSRKPVAIDIRVVAATNVDLRTAVGEGKFRLDLCFRLAVAVLELPPLRNRVDDIVPLAERFIAKYSARIGRISPVLSVGATNAMLEYQWPGNIRELENAIHSAVLLCSDGVIRSTDLRFLPWAAAGAKDSGSPSVRTAHQHSQEPLQSESIDVAPEASIDDLTSHMDQLLDAPHAQLLENFEAFIVWRAMGFCKGNQVHAARLLGITRNVLRTYLKRFGLLRTRYS